MNADGSAQTRLSYNDFQDADPSWSRHGSHIAFQSTRTGKYQIYVMNADGSGQTRLSNNDFQDSEPSWSPDGSD